MAFEATRPAVFAGRGPETKAQVMRVDNGPGRVVVGPKRLRSCFARIVSLRDGSGSIERYDPRSGTWSPAPEESITFSEIWSAPSAPGLVDIRREDQ
jgi:hypothetical protein